MSRIGKNPVEAPSGVELALASGALKVKGKLGEMTLALRDDLVQVEVDGGKATVTPRNPDDRRSRAISLAEIFRASSTKSATLRGGTPYPRPVALGLSVAAICAASNGRILPNR